jgi:hypothetical protein
MTDNNAEKMDKMLIKSQTTAPGENGVDSEDESSVKIMHN